MEKLRWFGWLPDGEKSSNFEDMFSRFDRTPERYGQTDKRTDGRTDGQSCYINIARQCADAR